MNIDIKEQTLSDDENIEPDNLPQNTNHHFNEKGILLFDNRRIRHLERMIDLFHVLFQKKN